jgi:hypothetical protein
MWGEREEHMPYICICTKMPYISRAKRFRDMAAATFVNADPKFNPNAVLMDNETGNTEMEKPTNGFLPGAIDPTPYEAFARWSNTIGRECDIGLPICRPCQGVYVR